jgi:hypothetical protein
LGRPWGLLAATFAGVACQVTCPVHRVGPILAKLGHGQPLFSGITAAKALAGLRDLLGAVGVLEPNRYRTHDLRRGHALDLQLSGAPLWEILSAGDWRSPAFLDYLNRFALERDMVMQAHLDESDHEMEG